MANVLAQISFALNRVYTQFYRAQGYDFDITNTTAFDQRYISGRNIYDNVAAIVDENFDRYIRRQGFVEPLSARFCNGTTSTCDGLSQWGSEALAQEGWDAMGILRHYYGDDIELVTDVPVVGFRESYPGTPQRLGSVGGSVVQIQVMVNRIAQDYPAIPRIFPVTGVFGPKTETSVKQFQSIFSLTADGVVGKATWYKMVYLYNGVSKFGELRSEGQRFYNRALNADGYIGLGDSGQPVLVIQYFLGLLGRYFTIPTVALDGVYGTATAQAVAAAQVALGLPQTGQVDFATYDAMVRYLKAIDLEVLDGFSLPEGSVAP